MTPRVLLNALICLMLLFAQHVALAESVTAAMYTSGDHQCAIEDGSSADADSGIHIALGDVDHTPVPVFSFAVLPPESHSAGAPQNLFFHSVVLPYYATRAPPLV